MGEGNRSPRAGGAAGLLSWPSALDELRSAAAIDNMRGSAPPPVFGGGITPEQRRTIAYFKSIGIDLSDPEMQRRTGIGWDGNPIDGAVRGRALDAYDSLSSGESAYNQAQNLGRPNPQADATSVANPSLSQLSLRGLFQDSKPFSGFR